ncbi:MAG: hypothetical protein NXH97_21065 [Rhodobacteraceae bacterium]|nr:hypothetical protein [Paracoccaceae bacterium]
MESSKLPIPGALLLAGLLYAAASIFAGQLIGTRMIDKSGWHITCPEGIKAAARPERPRRPVIKERRCSDVATFLGPFAFDAMRVCHEFNDPVVNGAEIRAEREVRAQQERLDEARVRQAARSAASQCACAGQVYRSDRMIALGVYAGTARQISLPGVEDMQTGLEQALGTPQCQAIGASG